MVVELRSNTPKLCSFHRHHMTKEDQGVEAPLERLRECSSSGQPPVKQSWGPLRGRSDGNLNIIGKILTPTATKQHMRVSCMLEWSQKLYGTKTLLLKKKIECHSSTYRCMLFNFKGAATELFVNWTTGISPSEFGFVCQVVLYLFVYRFVDPSCWKSSTISLSLSQTSKSQKY